MSDLSDDAEGVRILTEGGARFAGRNFGKTATARASNKPCQRCGTFPLRRLAYDGTREVLVCTGCGRQTEPMKSRQQLQAQWNGMN